MISRKKNSYPLNIPFKIYFDYNELVEKILIDDEIIQDLNSRDPTKSEAKLLKSINHSYISWLFTPGTVMIGDLVNDKENKSTCLGKFNSDFRNTIEILNYLVNKIFGISFNNSYAITLYQAFVNKKDKPSDVKNIHIVLYDLKKSNLSIITNITMNDKEYLKKHFDKYFKKEGEF